MVPSIQVPAAASGKPDMDELHRAGATLVITYVAWWKTGTLWVREQEHAIARFEPELRFVVCSGPADLSDIQYFGSLDQVSHCELCQRTEPHTKAAHQERWMQEISF